MATKADLNAANRILKAGVREAIARLRQGRFDEADNSLYVAVVAADMLMDPAVS